MKTNYKLAIALVAGAAIGGAAIQALHAQAKPPVYVGGENSVTNVDAYTKEFVPLARAAARSANRYSEAGKILHSYPLNTGWL